MRRLFLFAIALTLWAGVAFMLLSAARQDSVPKLRDNNPFQIRAAFRDGLYLGGLAAQRGEEPHVSEGRWSNQADRALFTTGYAQGYDEGITVRAAVVNRTHYWHWGISQIGASKLSRRGSFLHDRGTRTETLSADYRVYGTGA